MNTKQSQENCIAVCTYIKIFVKFLINNIMMNLKALENKK